MALLLTSAFSAQSAGLGKLSVYSGIGQQLNAEVGLTATPGEMGSMSAKLASHEAFREAGIEYMSVLSDVRITLDKNAAGQPVLKLTTLRPISEPFLHFLVELSWTSGRMVREYTFLLDPPELLQVAKPASVVAPAAPTGKALAPSPVAAQPKPVAVAEKKSKPSTGEYQVKTGDTLAKIARETRSESITLDQMLVALFNGNQDAFSGNNMNRLRAGKILRVPSAEEAGKVDPVEARKLVIGHIGEFNAYRNRLAGAAAEMPASEAAPKQQVSGTIKPQVEDKVPALAAKDKLEVSRTESVKAGKATGSSIEEDLIARDKALREASERIAQLEKNIENLKKLVEVKSQTGTKLQQESEAVAPKPVEPAKAEAPVTPVPPAPVAATEQPKPEEPKPAVPAEAPKPAEAAPPAPPPPAPPVAKKPPVTPPPPPEPSFIDENPEIVYGGGGLVALLLGYLGYSSWRRKKAQEEDLYDLAATPFAAEAGTPAGKSEPVAGTPATSFDTGDISIQGDFSESGLLTNEEIVDPVAEADVLMAYGRDRQAEEILQEGLNKDPSRPAIHMKLLELYAKQENIAQFESVANKLHDLSNGRGADWEKTVAVARTLGLSGGVFAGAAALAEAAKSPADAVEPSVTVESLQADNVAASEMQSLAMDLGEANVEAKAPAEEEVPSLEFDLDLGTTTGSDIAAAAEQAVSAPVPAEDIGLDFDFDLGTPEAKEAVEAVVEKAEAATDARLSLDEMDFDLDLGSPVETEKPETTDVPLSDIDISTDLPMTEGLAEDASVTGGMADLKLDFDLELEQEPAAEALAAGSAAGETIGQSEPADVAPQGKPDNPEVATKLELAQAYEEMGDLDGARELLNEVVNEGSDAQQAEARAKLDQLSA